MNKNNIKQALIINNKTFAIGDAIKVLYHSNISKEGILTDIDFRYKILSVTIKDEKIFNGVYLLDIKFDDIKDITKVENIIQEMEEC